MAIPMPAQGKTADQDRKDAIRYSCSKCQINYYCPKAQKPKCPLCDAKRRLVQMQNGLRELREQVERLHNGNARLQRVVNATFAMQEALELIDAADLTFLKSVLYRHRAERSSIQLRVTHGPAKGKSASAPANGFLALPRTSEPEAHICSSIGGVAMATYYEEAVRSSGMAPAMDTMMRALNQTLSAELTKEP